MKYAGDKGPTCKGTNPLRKKWNEMNYEIHKRHLARISTRIDTTAPVQFPHLKKKRKQEQLLEGRELHHEIIYIYIYIERFTVIEKENRLLLQKVSDIMQHSICIL